MPQHPIVHIEIAAKDREAAGKFYSEVFGWNVQQLPEMNYATFEAEGGPGGGFNPVDNKPPAPVVVYINTDNIDTTLKRIQELGGKVLQPKDDIPDMGQFAIFADPTGNAIGLFQPLTGEPSA
ncbi:MAG: VOC family protein [Anaerolineales bacterium]|jgi:predicted enzyme related to lactoylglutathione lyase